MQSPLADGRNSLFDVAELACCTVTPMRCLGRRVDAPSAAVRHPSAHGGLVCAVTTPTVAILTGSLVGRPVRNGDARLKHTATEKTAAVPVAEAESTKVLFCGAVLATVRNTREAPPGFSTYATSPRLSESKLDPAGDRPGSGVARRAQRSGKKTSLRTPCLQVMSQQFPQRFCPVLFSKAEETS